MNEENERFADFLNSYYCSKIMWENKLMIYIETANIDYDNLNINKSIYDFILAQQDDSKKLLGANFSFGGNFQQYVKTYLSGIDLQNDDKLDLLTNKSSKYLFY